MTFIKGRTYKIYSLNVGFNDIIGHLENQQRKAVEDSQAHQFSMIIPNCEFLA
jgi:predicted transcriptional regulator